MSKTASQPPRPASTLCYNVILKIPYLAMAVPRTASFPRTGRVRPLTDVYIRVTI